MPSGLRNFPVFKSLHKVASIMQTRLLPALSASPLRIILHDFLSCEVIRWFIIRQVDFRPIPSQTHEGDYFLMATVLAAPLISSNTVKPGLQLYLMFVLAQALVGLDKGVLG